jgi:uncharacterized protein YndB with AHSA1/START domain
MIRIERRYPAPPERIWQLWTTREGIESWWPPEGFKCEVTKLELRPGGQLVYSFTAVGPDQVEFMKKAGMPLTTVARKTFTEVVPTSRLAYLSMVDFVPGMQPYQQLTTIDIQPSPDGSTVVMSAEPMHDEEWTNRLKMGRENELDNLARVLAGSRS